MVFSFPQAFRKTAQRSLLLDKPDGKNQLYGTAIAAYQQQIVNNDTNMAKQF